MDLPAPVSPVSTFNPAAKFSSAFSMRTMSRTVSEASMAAAQKTERNALLIQDSSSSVGAMFSAVSSV